MSVLDVIIRNNNPALINPIIIALVEEKWKSFAERILRRRFLMTSFYLFTFLLTTILEQMESLNVRRCCCCCCDVFLLLNQIFHLYFLGRRRIRFKENEFQSAVLSWPLSHRSFDSNYRCIVESWT